MGLVGPAVHIHIDQHRRPSLGLVTRIKSLPCEDSPPNRYVPAESAAGPSTPGRQLCATGSDRVQALGVEDSPVGRAAHRSGMGSLGARLPDDHAAQWHTGPVPHDVLAVDGVAIRAQVLPCYSSASSNSTLAGFFGLGTPNALAICSNSL